MAHNKLPRDLLGVQGAKKPVGHTTEGLSLGVYMAEQDSLRGFQLGHSQVELAGLEPYRPCRRETGAGA